MDSEKIWWYASSEKKHGPYTAQELKKIANLGIIDVSDLIWKVGASDWVPASRVKGLLPEAIETACSNEAPPSLSKTEKSNSPLPQPTSDAVTQSSKGSAPLESSAESSMTPSNLTDGNKRTILSSVKSNFQILFSLKRILIVALATMINYILLISHVLSKEKDEIDAASIKKFGYKISTEFSFFEILNGAQFEFFWNLFVMVLIFSIPLLCSIHLVTIKIIPERHLGKRRLLIVVPTAVAAWMFLSRPSGYSIFDRVIDANLYFFAGIIVVVCISWIFDGFERK